MTAPHPNAGPAVCRACRRPGPRQAGRKRGYDLFECPACGTLLAPDTTAGEVRDLYDHYYDAATFAPPPVVAAALRAQARAFQPHRRTGRWLDVGFGEGAFLAAAQGCGWACYGTEISPGALAHGERQGWVVSAAPEADPRFVPHGFDVVTMVEVVEHVLDPDAFLRAAAGWLRPGGVLFVTTPNAEGLNRRLLGFDWSVVAPPEHHTLWTARGLRAALGRAGLVPRRVRTDGFNPAEVLARWRPAAGPRPAPVNRTAAGVALNTFFAAAGWRRRVKAGINRLLSAARAGDTLKVTAVRPPGRA